MGTLRTRIYSLLLALAAVLAVGAVAVGTAALPQVAWAAQTETDKIVIVHTNDVHCNVSYDAQNDRMGYAGWGCGGIFGPACLSH